MKTSHSRRVFVVLNVLFMLAVIVTCLYPILHIIFASFSSAGQLMNVSGLLWHPVGFSTAAYEAIFSNSVILNGYKNTLFILVVGTSLSLVMTIAAAYVLSSKDVFWKPFIMMLIIITMYFQGGLIPTYLTIKNLGLYDTLWSVILPVAISSYNLIIMRTYFMNIPDSLIESAELDGAGDFTKIRHIIIPLSGPIIAVMVLYYGVGYWNSWFTATMYISAKAKQPLQVILREILILNETTALQGGDKGLNISETIKYATIVVVMMPILIIYPLLQKYFISVVMVGAVKG